MTEEPGDEGRASIGIRRSKSCGRWRLSIAPTTAAESAAITAALREVLGRQGWRVVLTFLAMPGEVDLADLRNDSGTDIGRHPDSEDGPLTVHALEDPLERHPFGYLQPRADARLVDRGDIEAVLVPGLMFARDGGRLGSR